MEWQKLGKIGQSVMSKFDIDVSHETQKARMDICYPCERYNTTFHTCKECNCYMPMKTWLTNVECPLGKWKKGDAEAEDLTIIKQGKINKYT
jgi:hypothetical protein